MFKRSRTFRTSLIAAISVGLLAGCSSGEPGSAATYDPGEEVTLDFAFWGNDVRAGLYVDAIEAFNEEYPNITVNSQFLTFPEFWEKRQTEAAGGGLPDLMQFDYSYLRQYAQNGLLLNLGPYLGDVIDTEPLAENILSIGAVDDVTYAVPTSTNAWGLYTNPDLLAEVGVEKFEGGDWKDYAGWMREFATTARAQGETLYGGNDFTGRIQNFELQLRAEGGELFTEDGKPGFDEERLAEFWESGEDIRDGAAIPSQRLDELNPLGGFDARLTGSELGWDNFGASYLANLGEGARFELSPPPVAVEGAKDLYLKPSMLHAVAATTEHPEAAVTLLNFLVNSPEVGEIFGTNRGLPASETALEGASLGEVDEMIRDYEASIADRLGDAPPAPVVGFGSLEEKFRQLGLELGYGLITVDEAVDQFFSELDVVLNQ